MMRIILFTLFVISPVFGRTMLMAKYNMGKVTGTITFTQDNIGADVNISLDLSGLPSATYTLQLHEFRVNFDRLDRCSDENIGAILTTPQIGATTITSGRGSLTASGMDLSGTKSIEGRSFAISGNGIKVCATVEADTEYITAFAHLPANLGGTIIFRQKESSPSADTFMYIDLYFVGETVSTAPLTWQINEGQVKMDIDATTSMSNRCGSTILDLYNPDASSGVGCTTENHTNCKIGDLSGKHGDVTISTSSNTKLFFGDLRLPLSGDHSIIGKTIAFLTGNQYFACANIVQYPRMSAVANFSNSGVKGVIAFEQRSPLDSAMVHINLINMKSIAGGYHVHLFPVPQKLGRTESVCDNDDVEGHFNPFNVDIDSADYPASGNSTPDMYEVGDISGKFGTLANLDDCNETFVDPNLQLYGKNSIIGRSMVIHRNDQSASRWICSTIWPSKDTPMYTAYAKFTYPVIGYIIMRQPKNMWYAETQVYVELNYGANGMQTATVNHTWHVHETELGNDMLRPETERCMSVGGHYNPYGVNLGGDYPTDCNPDKQFRCELGDLSGKHGKLNIRTANGKRTKYFFTDMQLPLNGPQSIMGKSIVIHDANSGAGRLGCGNLYEKIMRTAEVRAWSPAINGGTPTGTITFSQDCVDILACPTTVDVELTGLNNEVAGYHVHEFPLGSNTPTNQVCQLSDTGGHLNPFGAPYPLPPGDSLDAYEIGDLSGKFDPLTGASYSTNELDINLPMEGPYSIVGRPIVIHKNDTTATRWACGNILETTPGSTLIQAKAVFEGEIYGSVQMSQYKYDSGDMSDTFIVVDLKYKNGTTTTGHNWHVHERRMASPGDCGSCGDHYNPYMVDLINGYLECSMYNPLRCEMGDQSAKVGQYSIGGGKRFFTDVNLNLEATFSASKRSIVFHDVNGGAARIACANIMPDGNSVVESELSFVKTTYTSSDVENKVALSIGTNDSNVLVVHKQETLTCTTVKVYFLGDLKTDLQRLFNDVLRSSDHGQLGKYKPTAECVTGRSCILQMSLLTMLVCLCLTKLRLLS